MPARSNRQLTDARASTRIRCGQAGPFCKTMVPANRAVVEPAPDRIGRVREELKPSIEVTSSTPPLVWAALLDHRTIRARDSTRAGAPQKPNVTDARPSMAAPSLIVRWNVPQGV